jgi:hypothetical protein
MSAGTSGDITISLYGTDGELLNFPLNTPTIDKQPFQEGSLDRFTHSHKSIGNVTKFFPYEFLFLFYKKNVLQLKKINIGTDETKKSGAWKLEYVWIYIDKDIYK